MKSNWPRLLLFALMCVPTHTVLADVGFYSPSGVREEFASIVDQATINASGDTSKTAQDFKIAAENGLKLNFDLSPVIATPRSPQKLKNIYKGATGEIKEKQFLPTINNKLRDFLPDHLLRAVLEEQAKAIAPYETALNAVFLIDEPYLNGVSRSELERVGKIAREVFANNGIPKIKLGVLFAGPMFNADFAKHAQSAATSYVKSIDDHLINERKRILGLPEEAQMKASNELSAWMEIISKHRLTTYDTAENMFTEGGIPFGFNIVAFDSYTSTALFDALYENAISWLATRTGISACGSFVQIKMSDFRKGLSFFQSGPTSEGDKLRPTDKAKLDDLYSCRMQSILTLLVQEIQSSSDQNIEIMVVSESSNNGFLEFDPNLNIEAGQPDLLVKKRVIEEINRGLELYTSKLFPITSMLFFTFDTEYDNSINLEIGGASAVPSAVESIAKHASRNITKLPPLD